MIKYRDEHDTKEDKICTKDEIALYLEVII